MAGSLEKVLPGTAPACNQVSPGEGLKRHPVGGNHLRRGASVLVRYWAVGPIIAGGQDSPGPSFEVLHRPTRASTPARGRASIPRRIKPALCIGISETAFRDNPRWVARNDRSATLAGEQQGASLRDRER